MSFLLTCKLRSARLSRWTMFLQEYNFTIEYCRGSENVTADVLSRIPEKDISVDKLDYYSNADICLFKIADDFENLRKNLKRLRRDQIAEKWISEKIEVLEGEKSEDKVTKWFVMHEGLLFRRGSEKNPGFKLCVPKSQCKSLVLAHHNGLGHFGKTKTYLYMRQLFFWPKMAKHVRQIVTSCELCQKAKSAPICKGLLNPVVVNKPGELVCLDLIGPLPRGRGGVVFLLVIVDAFTKFVELYALRNATTKAILAKLFDDYIANIQKPKSILSDNGSQFTSHGWTKKLTEADIKVKLISVYFPQGNMTERYNKEIVRMLRTYWNEKHTTWPTMISFVEDCLNNSISLITGYSPSYLQTGVYKPSPILKYVKFPEDPQPQYPLEHVWTIAYDSLKTKAQKRAEKINKNVNPTIFNTGDLVLVRTHYQSSALDKTIKKFFYYMNALFILSVVRGQILS